MKVKSIVLLLTTTLTVSILPITNIALGGAKFSTSTSKSDLFNIDYYTGKLNLIRSKLGYSSAPTQAIVGYNGWLFLGNRYAQSLTVKRGLVMPSEENFNDAKLYRASIQLYAQQNGVQGTFFIIAPNKEDVYSEHLPKWIQPENELSFSDRFMTERDENLINLYPVMLQARERTSLPIYYRTDSHWNTLGAWFAYKHIVETIGQKTHELNTLTDDDITIVPTVNNRGGDISAFLFMREHIKDVNPTVSIKKNVTIKIENATTGELIYQGANRTVGAGADAVKVVADSALNQMRVLWLRDSFGGLLSPFMATTFSETIHQHWTSAYQNRNILEALIKEHQPDLVLFTIVGRSYANVINKS